MRNIKIFLVLGLVLTLTACGRRGPLELPDGTTAAPETPANEATIPSIGRQKKKTVTTTQVPTDSFVLDPILD